MADLSDGQRYWSGGALLAVAATIYAILHLVSIPGSEPVEFDLRADQGTTRFSLAPEPKAVSPGCGCPNPEFGKQPWEGMSVPSTGFDLRATTDDNRLVDPKLWSLTVMAPNTSTINWFGQPNRAIWLYLEVEHANGTREFLFAGGASHFLLWTNRAVSIKQPQANPYAAVLPAAGGWTTFTSHEPSRAQLGGTLDISSKAPARAEADPKDGYSDPEVGQRGPLVDIIGPTVNLSTTVSSGTRLWAARHEIHEARPGDRLLATITTPFALRLIPHPVPTGWESDILSASSRRASENILSLKDEEEQPRAQARLLPENPLPSYTVHMNNVQAPDQRTWDSFAERSAKEELVSEMMGFTQIDPLPTMVWRWSYGLPPVTKRPQVGIFGHITRFDSTSVGGQAVIGASSHPIPQGERLRFESDVGLGAGVYQFTPLVSSGQETTETSISGQATVYLGGELASHPSWLPYVQITAWVSAIFWIVLGFLLSWWFRKEEKPSYPEREEALEDT
jgi:hypothetical protein